MNAVAETLSERDLQRNVRAMLDQFGWKTAVTWNSLHSPKGWPDIFAVRSFEQHLIQGRPVMRHRSRCTDICRVTVRESVSEAVAIELKSEKGKVSPEQEAWLDLLRRLPGVKFAGVIRPSDWYAGALDEVLR